ncbi:MAG TPA: N-acetylmuramic acid 6-phosphate etherase [Gemmatimonadales bacterium]|nr:N-acetylmuramic acid 6-phosphate etherase [Gemmatimonadales bacterium]
MHDPDAGTLRATERRNPRTAAIDTATPLEIVDLLAAEDATVPLAVARAREQLARVIELVEASFRSGGRLLYVGAGTSGRLGVLDASECPPTFGTAPTQVVGIMAGGFPALVRSAEGAEDDVNAGLDAMTANQVGTHDTVVGIAASGVTPYVRAALGRAQALGAATALVACAEPPAVLREGCDACVVIETGPEAITGSTRMKAGTATKLALNTITTGAMVRLGKTWGNLMVDLQATSAKLVDRGERIVMEATGCERAEARAAIDAADGSVRTAIVMQRLGLSLDAARQRLLDHDHRLRAILGEPPPHVGTAT